jgi:hypothetical protein
MREALSGLDASLRLDCGKLTATLIDKRYLEGIARRAVVLADTLSAGEVTVHAPTAVDLEIYAGLIRAFGQRQIHLLNILGGVSTPGAGARPSGTTMIWDMRARRN